MVAKTAEMFLPRSAKKQVGPIGIDIALEEIHVVQLESSAGKPPILRARASLPLECTRRELIADPNKFRALIKHGLNSGPFNGSKAVLAMPSGMFRTVSINYQSGSGEKQESAAILRVMKDRLDGNLQDYVLDYMPVKGRSKNDERLALVAVSERKDVLEYLDLARQARLDVSALEIGPVAISRLVRAISAGQGTRNVLVINSGRDATFLTLISGNDLLFDQEVDVGEKALIQQICDTLDMSEEMARDLVLRTGVLPGPQNDRVSAAIDESGLFNTLAEILKPQFLRLVEEIKRAFLYAAAETRGGSVTQVYLLGSIVRWPGSDRLLSSLTGVDVARIPNPLALIPSDSTDTVSDDNVAAPEIAVATGLALRGMNLDG